MKKEKLPIDIMNHHPVTEQRNPNSFKLDQSSVSEILQIINNEDKTVAIAVENALSQVSQAIDGIVNVMNKGGRLFYTGAGTSGRLGILDASECPPTFGVKPDLVHALIAGGDVAIKTSVEGAEDNKSAGRKDIESLITANDAVVGITASGQTPYVLGAVEAAKDCGAITVGISCNKNTQLSQAVQFPIEVLVGPEVITGSTRMKAGTAQKMVLNMITSTIMIKLGKVYGNLMVNVQAKNKKLKERVVRIVQEATGVDENSAQKYSDLAQGNASVAILMIQCQVSQLEARQCLEKSQWNFGEAMKILAKKNGNE